MKRASVLAVAFAVAIVIAGWSASALAVTVTGTVVDRSGKPVEYANVAVPALERGAVTDAEGRFSIDLPLGSAAIEVSQIGYQRSRLAVSVVDGLAPMRIVLAEEPVPVGEVVVAASSFGKSGKSEGAVVRRLDIMTTPGGAADVFQALRALPGINAPNEGAALYVRGGDPHETLIRLDGGPIGHPYHYEGASGGLFSAFDAYMLKSAFFSSGGFSSKYGGVLSGVLDIETQDPMDLKTVSVGANVVGAGLSSSWALIPSKLSFVGTMRFSDVELLQKLYGSSSEYLAVPHSQDGTGRLLYRYSSTGRASLLFLDSGDRVGVLSSVLNYRDRYTRHSSNRFAALQLQDAIGSRVAIKGQVSGQLYESGYGFGPIGLDEEERNGSASVDVVWSASTRHELSFGASVQRPWDEITGATIADSTDYQSGAPTKNFSTHARLVAPGFYLEDKLRLWGPLYATIGGRFDYASTPGVWTSDPRAALAWRVDDHQTVRVAAGRYHQLPDPRFLDPVYGNPELSPLQADHWIAGYEWKTEHMNVRLEGYDKRYRDLITNDAATYYANGGTGFARGTDLFVQGSRGRLSGWVSYGYLDSKRKELDDPIEVAASYGVRHSVTVVGEYQLSPFWMVGGRYGDATGRPYTPIVGRSYDSQRDLWRPVYGDHNSEEMPEYRRLDLRLTRLFSLPAGMGLPSSNVCVFYVEAMNVLGTPNALEYTWNTDYTVRRTQLSYFSRRLAVAGVGLTW
jgi:outer membrane cobalamin receptor